MEGTKTDPFAIVQMFAMCPLAALRPFRLDIGRCFGAHGAWS